MSKDNGKGSGESKRPYQDRVKDGQTKREQDRKEPGNEDRNTK